MSVSFSSDDEAYVWIDSWLADQCQMSTTITTTIGPKTTGQTNLVVANANDKAASSSAVVPKRVPSFLDIVLDCIWSTGRVPPRHLYITNAPLNTARHTYGFKADPTSLNDDLGRPVLHPHPQNGTFCLVVLDCTP